jgi:outer membrane protein OmpA-like peptidoglycan-associated protein
LADELRGLGYEVREVEGGKLSLDLRTEVPFAFDSATLPASAGGALTDLAEVLARDGRTRVTVVGHTDDVGPEDYNRRLSLERARAVEAYLRGRGMAQENLASLGMGEDVPVRLDGDPDATVHQRRIELLLEPR